MRRTQELLIARNLTASFGYRSGAGQRSFASGNLNLNRDADDLNAMDHALDNVIWKALTSSQSRFSESTRLARKFPAEVSSLAALLEPTREAYASLAGLLTPGATTGLVL